MTVAIPTTRDQAIAQLTEEGNDLKVTMLTAEANVETWFPGKRYAFYLAHWLLDKAGYILEEACGVPDGTFGAGGGNKGPPGGGGG